MIKILQNALVYRFIFTFKQLNVLNRAIDPAQATNKSITFGLFSTVKPSFISFAISSFTFCSVYLL